MLNDKPLCAALLAFGMASAVPATAEEAVSAECRGVAAGIVASMRAAGELTEEGAVAPAILAARRGCNAALNGLTAEPVARPDADAASTTGATNPGEANANDDDPSLWDMLTSTRERKAGNDRLRRLKTQ